MLGGAAQRFQDINMPNNFGVFLIMPFVMANLLETREDGMPRLQKPVQIIIFAYCLFMPSVIIAVIGAAVTKADDT
ncbi:hypothetical protein BGW38_004610 [Lunasporangiospora selenospora]|uniref:Uncharacterized protein n=1 Tax=Lunasporangiospora selenospora TaxID=979761 RepID=A0A9P6KGQ5_9FUNG|nr:hypothetical protein BGW38_004610 [Lunasporangiospora selenospora]